MDKKKAIAKSTATDSTRPKILKPEYKIEKKSSQQAKPVGSNGKSKKILISKRFTSEIAAKIIQRNFRLYMKRIKSHPSYEMKQMLRKKKLGLLQSYHLTSNKEDSKKAMPASYEPIAKPQVVEVAPVNEQPPCKSIQSKEESYNKEDSKKKEVVSIKQQRAFNMGYDYEEKSKLSLKEEEEKNDDIVNIEKEVNHYIEEQNNSINQLIGETQADKVERKKIKDAFIEEEDNHIENVYERIYKEMIKDKNSNAKEAKEDKKPSKTQKESNSNDEQPQQPKKSPAKNAQEQLLIKKPIPEEDKASTVKKDPIISESFPEKYNEADSISLSEQKSDIVQSKKEIYTRLTKFLDNSDQSMRKDQNDPLPQPKMASLPEPTTTLNAYLTDTKLQADNLGLNLELKEAKKTIDTMSSIICDLKEQLQKKDEAMTKSLLHQKEELDATLNRQNTLMEGLYSEKKKSESQIGELQEKLSQIERSSYKKLQSIKENYELEMKKNKDAWVQAEKLNRKKWQDQKVKEIKDLTAKGLEPEIEKIISNHKAEIAHLEEDYTLSLKAQKERLLDEYDLKFSELKHRLTKEKEELIDHEKNLAVQRLRNQSERLEEEINEERRRWNSKMQNEITRLEALREKDKKLYEDQIAKLEERNSNSVFSNEEFLKKRLDDMKKTYEDKLTSEIALIKANIEKDNEVALSLQKNALEAKYKEMKLELLKDRDKQINIVIEKLGEEAMAEKKKNQSDCEKKANERNLALIEENSLMKKQVNDLSLKLQAETKNRAHLEETIEQMTKRLNDKEADLNRKEKQLTEITGNYSNVTEKLGGLTREFNKERMNLEIEMKSHLQKGEAELTLLNNKLQTAQKLFENQKMEIEAIHRREVEDIGQKIEKSLKHRDDIIKKLQEEVQLKEITIQKYEEMLNQQRRDFLAK